MRFAILRAMNSAPAPRISKVPFIIGDLLLLAAAVWLVWSHSPLDGWHIGALVGAVAAGAWLATRPFVLQFHADMKLAETTQLTSVAAQLGNLETVARQIASATAEWQHVNESATQAVTAADQVAERMTAEARNFSEVLGRMNETEKNHLRLEVDKLRRGEGEWLQIVVRILDHVHALHEAGIRSGQRNVIEQLSHFQSACRDTARRVGLIPVLPANGAAFDPKQHQLLDGQTVKNGGMVGDTIAPGYTFQGQLLRLPVVALSEKADAEKPSEPQLSFGETA